MGYIRELLWPRRCPVCGEVAPWGEWICPECRDRLPRVKEPRCKRCGLPIAEAEEEYCENCRERDRSFDDGVVGFRYNSPVVRNLILQAKDRNLRQYYDYPCALMAEIYRERIRRFLPECLIPVPLYPAKRRQRGFNQSEEIARRLSEAWGIPMRPEILLETESIEIAKRIALEAGACMLCSNIYVDDTVREKGGFYPLEDYENHRHFYACYPKNDYLPKYALDLIEIFRTVLSERGNSEFAGKTRG